MDMRDGIKQSCDIYFYEVARKLGIDRLSVTAEKFGLGKQVLKDFIEERNGVVPNTEWKKKYIGKNWYLGETLHAGIGQGYWQSSPLQLCLMTAQIANGGYKIRPRIIINSNVYLIISSILFNDITTINKGASVIKLYFCVISKGK